MEQDRSYILVGTFVLLGILGIISFAVWMNATSGARDYLYYQIRFYESVSGLSEGSPVKYRGVDIGNVFAIKIDLAETNTIITHIRVVKGTPIKQDTVAMLKIQGITGASYIDLSGGDINQMENIGSPADKSDLPEIPSKVSNIATLSNEIPELIGKTSHVATQAERMFDDEALENVHSIIKRWDNISTAIERQTEQMDLLVKTTAHLAQTTDKVMSQVEAANIGETLKDLRKTSAQLNELSTNTNEAAQVSFENFNELLLDAKRTSNDIRAFTRNLNENPSQVIFPTRDKQETLP